MRSSALWSLAIAVIYVGTSVALLELGVNMTAFLIIGAVAAIMQGLCFTLPYTATSILSLCPKYMSDYGGVVLILRWCLGFPLQ